MAFPANRPKWAGTPACRARLGERLMPRLGYTRYVAQGGDVGALITDAMGRQAPAGLLGIHTNLLVPALGAPQSTDSEQERAAALAAFRTSGSGYFLEQATRPQTIGYALLDSPVALAAWMLDQDTDSYQKIAHAFVDGQPSGGLTRDHVVDNITLYWLTGTGAGGPRVLGEWPSHRARGRPGAAARLGPVGFTTFPGEIFRAPAHGRESLPHPRLLQRGRQGRPLRRLGGARAFRRGGPGGVQVAPVTRARWSGPLRPTIEPNHWCVLGGPDHQHVVRGGEADRCRCPECRLCRSRPERWVRGHPAARLAPRAARRPGARCQSNQPSRQSTSPKPYSLAVVARRLDQALAAASFAAPHARERRVQGDLDLILQVHVGSGQQPQQPGQVLGQLVPSSGSGIRSSMGGGSGDAAAAKMASTRIRFLPSPPVRSICV